MSSILSLSQSVLVAAGTTLISQTALMADPGARTASPNAIIDLRTVEGVTRVQVQWRYSDTHINEIDHRGVGPDLKASGPKNRTFDFTPDARAADFDDTKWELIPADSLEKRRGSGRLSFNWYRINVTLPEKTGGERHNRLDRGLLDCGG